MATPFKLQADSQALIIGGGHGIGLGLVQELVARQIKVVATYRLAAKAPELLQLAKAHPSQLQIFELSPQDEESLATVAKSIGPVDLLINSIGVLQDDVARPERSLRELDLASLVHAFTVNAAITPLLAKHFASNLKKTTPTCFAAISAKVGSIGDNRLGGWYGYRASKAALNMFLKNIALEFKRNRQQTVVLSLHPGTTITDLSKDHIKNSKYRLHTPRETAAHLLAVIEGKSSDDSGEFYSWDNSPLPW